MARLSDLPEFYAVVVMLPAEPGGKPTTVQVNGRVAKAIHWLLQTREGIEMMHVGQIIFNYGPDTQQAWLNASSPAERVRRSTLRKASAQPNKVQ